ncbi:MAG: prephenate dehydratase domain-containing protein [Verrucomicrobiota bacterium]|nr:prephenate dehydratase domain-containing protein [Verrucomicrobiota bacterium]
MEVATLKGQMPKKLLKITYFGVEGSFSHIAARRRFSGAEFKSGANAYDCFCALRQGVADQIVVPIENASAGIIDHTVAELIRYASWKGSQYAVREELAMTIELLLMGKGPLTKVKRIYSHPAPFDHCDNWLRKHLPTVDRIAKTSTAQAAMEASRDPEGAAIASAESGQRYKLQILSKDVGREAMNKTKFFVVGKPLKSPKGALLLTIFFELPHRSGALCDVLMELKKAKINMTRISSRPIFGRHDEYTFMIEVEMPATGTNFDKIKRKLEKLTDTISFEGVYPLIQV